ncbi:MAG: polynucleotide adenylyltransferase PcnB [Deltaproteobacteria bacterium]|nr:polynucleotide adenylyltransferase PcnB [Deltaproteobacteria bacterium]
MSRRSMDSSEEAKRPTDDRHDGRDDGDERLEGPPPAVYDRPIPDARVDPDAAKVLRRLTRYGHTAYLVGGGVRDLLLGRSPKDFDVATSALPQEVRRLFRNCRVIGRRFRLAHILFADGKIIETATFRRDPAQRIESLPGILAEGIPLVPGPPPVRLVPITDGAAAEEDLLIRNDNVFGAPYEDAVRRDFTINGLFYDLERGQVIDYVGGMPDLLGGVLRAVGDPAVRLREDPVRILRAIKFSARLDMGIDPDLYDAIVRHKADLGRAAKPRLLEEILRFMRGGAGHRSYYLCWDTGVLAELLPELAAFLDDDAPDAGLTWSRLAIIDRMHAQGELPSDAVTLSALLLGPIEEAIEGVRDPSRAFEDFMFELTQRLTLPRRLKDRMRALIASQRRLRSGKLGTLPRRDYFPEALALFMIDRQARGEIVPEWAHQESKVETPPTRRRRRRRRPRG